MHRGARDDYVLGSFACDVYAFTPSALISLPPNENNLKCDGIVLSGNPIFIIYFQFYVANGI